MLNDGDTNIRQLLLLVVLGLQQVRAAGSSGSTFSPADGSAVVTYTYISGACVTAGPFSVWQIPAAVWLAKVRVDECGALPSALLVMRRARR